MRKNGSRLISFRQYRLTDIFLFAVLLVVFELILHFAFIAYNGKWTFSPLVPMTLLVMMRWGWPSVFFAVGDGILYCALNAANYQNYIIYGVGNAFIMLLLLMIKFMGKQRIAGKWYFSALFVVLGWFAVVIGKATIASCFGLNFLSIFTANLTDLFSLGVAVIVILVMRRLDGMFEDQKFYLRRLEKERKEKFVIDAFGDEPIEIDEESISILKRDYDGLD